MTSKYSKDSQEKLRNAIRELSEMYLCSNILNEVIYPTLKKAIKAENKIANQLAEKTGRPVNSIYKDKNTLTNYNAANLLRYFVAMEDICKEHNINEKDIPSLDDIVKKHRDIIKFTTLLNNEINLDSIVSNSTEIITNIVLFYNQNPLPVEKQNAKQSVLNELSEHHIIKKRLLNREKLKLSKQREEMMRID